MGVLTWAVAFAVAERPAGEIWVFELLTAAGYGLAGIACWRWIEGNWHAQAGGSPVRGPSTWMAAASAVTAAGVARLTYWTYQVHTALSSLRNADPYNPLRVTGATAGTLGFLFAAAGFWIASSAHPGESVPELVVFRDGNSFDKITDPVNRV